MTILEEELALFHNNQHRLAKLYPNSFLVIKGQQIYGGFPSILEAYSSALEKFKIGTFLVIKTIRSTDTIYKQILPTRAYQNNLSWLVNNFFQLYRNY